VYVPAAGVVVPPVAATTLKVHDVCSAKTMLKLKLEMPDAFENTVRLGLI
jgi:hypothetical protein